MAFTLGNVKLFQSCFRSVITNYSHNLRTLSPLVQSSNVEVIRLNNSLREFHISSPRNTVKPRDRKDLTRGVLKMDEGTEGEYTETLGANIRTKEDMFTDERTPDLLFNGVRFADVPICHIKVTKNNTIMSVSDGRGKQILQHSCGIEGFKNARKGTNVAAQATAFTISKKALNVGVKDVRIKIQGLGPGRMASIRGVQLGGLNIISITDDTRVPWKLRCRPKKQRRL